MVNIKSTMRCVALLALVTATPALADVVTVSFTGTIDPAGNPGSYFGTPRPAAIRSGPQRPASLVDKQVRITTAKLNLDLYDRRFKVFEAALISNDPFETKV
jgi:hypothetical protein